MSNNRPMFPPTFDSTMLATFRSCPQKFFRTYIEHWKPKAESVHLIAGGAFAKGIEAARMGFYEGKAYMLRATRGEGAKDVDYCLIAGLAGDREAAEGFGLAALLDKYGDFECPPDSAKSRERTAGALEFYYANYPLGADGARPLHFPDGRSAIEFSFAEPLSIVHPVSGDPILYTGRCDMIAEFAGGVYAVDEKTTSSLGASWPRQWEMRAQFTGYQWAANRAGLHVEGTLVRGVSILKTKYDTMQAITYRAPFEVDRWMRQVERDIERAIQMWEDMRMPSWEGGWGHDAWDYALDHACAEYGGCSMLGVCKSPEPESWLPMYFERRVWDPLARKELSPEEWEASWGHVSGA
jgi:hypothetical protein